MRVLLELLFNQNWLLFIFITCINAYWLRVSSRKYILANAELEEGYARIFRWMLFYGNIPWLIIGIGNLTGLTKSTFDYFTPRQQNPIVLLFHAILIVYWIVSIRWIYFNKGAEFLEQHPGLWRQALPAWQFKIIFLLMLLGGAIGMVMLWVKNPSMPNIQF